MPWLAWIAAALIWLTFSGAPPVCAQAASLGSHDEEARALFEAGRVAYEDGRYEDALGYFERSFELSHRSALHFNLGLAYDRLRRDREALAAFEAYLESEPDPERAVEVQNRVRALRESLAAEDAARAGNSEEKQAALTVLPRRDDPDRVRKRRLWIGIAAGVVTLAAGVTISLIATRDDDDGQPAPNSGVTIEAFAWR